MEKKQQENKKEKFKRIAENRTNKIIDMLRLLGNCSNTNNYDFEKEDIDRIMNALERELKGVKNKFENALTENTTFKL